MNSPDPVASDKIRCDACPVLCYIAEGRAGACDRYANQGGQLVRLDPLTAIERGAPAVPFLECGWDGNPIASRPFLTAVGAGTTYPDYKPAPFIVSEEVEGVEMVTVVTEGIFSYCGVKVKIDTDRHIGPERALVRAGGEPVGHVTTTEYGSKMLSLGGVEHLTGGGKAEGRVTCETLLKLCNKEEVTLEVDEGAAMTIRAGTAPVIDGKPEALMRVGCGSAAIGMFAVQWAPHADEVIVVDDHITGVLSEHQAGRMLGLEPTGIRVKGRRSTPGRYFKVAEPGAGWGGTNVSDPLDILLPADKRKAKPGMTLFMVSTTGEDSAFFRLDEDLLPREEEIPPALVASAERVRENCEPALVSVLFMAGAGGSLRAGVTENPVGLTRSVRNALTQVTIGGAPAYLWPGGGITVMADVLETPENAFGYVPTPALVAPVEFTLRREDFVALGGHADRIRPVSEVLGGAKRVSAPVARDPRDRRNFRWGA